MNDEDFEKSVVSSYMTYVVCEVTDEPTLIPLESQCHRMPSKDILQTDSVSSRDKQINMSAMENLCVDFC